MAVFGCDGCSWVAAAGWWVAAAGGCMYVRLALSITDSW
jgi:hypothetical protein